MCRKPDTFTTTSVCQTLRSITSAYAEFQAVDTVRATVPRKGPTVKQWYGIITTAQSARFINLGRKVRNVILAVAILSIVLYNLWQRPPFYLFFDKIAPINDPRGIYVPGTGFSGFWFLLGRLQSISNKRNYNYYCFSSGCLATVSALTNTTKDDVLNIATDIQKRFGEGSISRFDVVESFVDELIAPNVVIEKDILQHLRIIRATKGIGLNIQTATSVTELKELLIQSAFIPFITGWGLSRIDDNGQEHVDGGFLSALLPPFDITLGTPMEYTAAIRMNTFNFMLSEHQVNYFYESGHSYGV